MAELGRNELLERLQRVGEHLAAEGETIAIVVVGGAALSLGEHLQRTTEDVDIYARAAAPPESGVFVSSQHLPQPLLRAAAKVARDYELPDNWMNSVVAPHDLSDPPPGFAADIRWLHLDGLIVGIAGRAALIALKLHAAVDRDKHSVHVQDLLALRPTDEELEAAAAWVKRQDIGTGFSNQVEAAVAYLRKRRHV